MKTSGWVIAIVLLALPAMAQPTNSPRYPSGKTVAAPRLLTMDGIGDIHIGMTQQEVEKAIGAKLNMSSDASGNAYACSTAKRVDGNDSDITYMFVHGRIATIEIWHYDADGQSTPPDKSIMTTKGIGLWSTEADVKRAYGKILKVEPAPYDTGGHYLILNSPGRKKGLIFETEKNGRVQSYRSGVYPALGFIEGCA